ncbi:hypothetical protein BD324DRAFT_634336 [Kockovaella imperatae]|uniref:non-specific serine/threonine protein kinase n=1 Tax=Kockovaella imperatae TaxID=4999 RepID=A0A1Y1U9D9_9TREE|nr:hypothetical protein BD324DRAFT_634336 [Kockovaella imperatae]ORX34648.1 hypothetical protein BD324DRAFT_634336 [Kockovaella imperatae]
MGNISSMARASTALDSYVAELGNDISYEKSLSSSRFLKSILARHAYGPLVLKIFIKPDATMSLRVIQRRLKAERDALADLGSVNTYQAFVETEKAGYLIRQWVGAKLYDRVSTQPYLSLIEKKWIAYQLLTALRDSRAKKVAHGDIKSENILILSDLTLLLTDFSSSFKPTFLPLDDPSDFSFFFDTSSRRTCYVAPERFYASDSKRAQEKRAAATAVTDESWGKRDGKVTEEMDVFSAGCVIAEMWTDGRTVFNLSELFAYRDGSLGLDGILDNIEDASVKTMISQMLSLDPAARPSFDHILATYRETIFPEYFYTFLKDYVSSLSEHTEQSDLPFLQRVSPLPGTKIDRLLEEWDSISVYLNGEPDGPALLLLNSVTSSIRNCLWPSSRLHGLQLFLNLLPFISDEDKVDRIVPFVADLLTDDVAIVRAEACRTMGIIVESVTSITPHNATFIPEYLLPQMRHLATDPDVFVRATCARGLVRIADAAVRMLEMSQAAKSTRQEEVGVVEPDYDSMLHEIQSVVEEQATTLLVDPTSAVKRSMLSDIAGLCLFFGRQKSSETVLSHIMTYLNDRDWLLRLAFFDGIVGVGAFIGIRAIEEYVLPLMLQALADPEEAVVARVITALTSLSSLRLLPRMRIWDVFFSTYGFLCHPNIWIRQGTAGFIASASKNLPSSDVWCILYPALRTLLESDILEVDEASILSSVLEPLSRATLVAAKAAALADSPRGFWTIKNEPNIKAAVVRLASATLPEGLIKGISAKDETKVVAMKEFIIKQAHATRAREMTGEIAENVLSSGKSVSLTDLGVTPQTIFISPRTVRVDAKSDLKRLRPFLAESSSRRTSFTNRSAKENPIDEIRKRLAFMETAVPAEAIVESTESPSESGLSSTIDVKPGSRKRLDSKALPAIGASHTTVTGLTSIHDDAMSGRATPMADNPTYASSYEGPDPGLRAFLEQVDLENYREPLLDFGPKVSANQRKRAPRPKSTSATPGVTMIGHLTQHTGPITAIVTPPDHLFFATASEDGQILIWDSARLERMVATRARLAYSLGSPVTCMCRIDATHCLAAASQDGQLQILRVHVANPSRGSGTAKYAKVESVKSWRAPVGHVIFVHHRDSALLVVTSTSLIGFLDIRAMDLIRKFQHPLEFGAITTVCPSTHWIIVGTDLGILSLWDLRFGLLLKSWRASGPITACHIHPARGRGRWVMVSTTRASPIVEVYDIESAKLVEMFELSRPSSKMPSTDVPSRSELVAEMAKQEAKAATEGDEALPAVLSLLPGHGAATSAAGDDSDSTTGWVVTADEDRAIRLWDVVKASDSFVICGSPKELDVVFKQTSTQPLELYTVPSNQRQGSERQSNSARGQQPLRPHYDAICALASVETPFSSCIISGDRSGVIKVWRMEGKR